ncbi:putative manganese transporter, partial [Candidatus Puniceispirillum sp.]|nr:putative manganese transporter [Candidatus Puniceispirillum sp.]
MSPLANAQPASGGPRDPATVFHSLLILLPVLLAGYVMTHVESEFNGILFKAIADAYIQVSTFVAGTFFIFYGIERVLNIDAAAAL